MSSIGQRYDRQDMAADLNLTMLRSVYRVPFDELTATFANRTAILSDNMSIITLEEEENYVLTMKVQVLFYMIYSVIFLIGVFGNFLVVYAVLRNKAMQTVTNYFILNLAFSDILLCVLCVPFTPLYTFLGRWIFGKALCHLVTCTQGVSIYISSLTLTTIAIDRFFVIIYPFRPRMMTSTCVALILGTWLFSVGATLPYAYFVQHKPLEDGRYVCQEDFPEDIRLTFGSVTTVLQFVIPFLIMTIMYSLISLKLSSRARSKPGSKSVRKEQADRERKKRTNRMLIAMVAVFGVSWLPLNLMNLMDDISSKMDLAWERWEYFHLLFFVAHAIAMSSTCYNPFLYAWLNENFRKEFKEILPCFRPGGSQRTVEGTQREQRNGTAGYGPGPATEDGHYGQPGKQQLGLLGPDKQQQQQQQQQHLLQATYDTTTENVQLLSTSDDSRLPRTLSNDGATQVTEL